MPDLVKKLIVTIGILTLVLFIGLIAGALYLGAFESVEITERDAGPYYFLSRTHAVFYPDVQAEIDRLQQAALKHDISRTEPCALIFDNPLTTPPKEIRCAAGFVIRDSIHIDSTLVIRKIPERRVVYATIDAHPTIAVFKIYPAIQEYAGRDRLVLAFDNFVLEKYPQKDRTVVEMPVTESTGIRPDTVSVRNPDQVK